MHDKMGSRSPEAAVLSESRFDSGARAAAVGLTAVGSPRRLARELSHALEAACKDRAAANASMTQAGATSSDQASIGTPGEGPPAGTPSAEPSIDTPRGAPSLGAPGGEPAIDTPIDTPSEEPASGLRRLSSLSAGVALAPFALVLEREEGDGIIIGRSATRLAAAQTQAEELDRVHVEQGRTARSVISVVVSGSALLDQRADLLAALEAVEAGWCRWVAFQGCDRISRSAATVEAFIVRLQNAGGELYLGEMVAAPLSGPALLAALGFGVDTEARQTIVARTEATLRSAKVSWRPNGQPFLR